MHKILRLFNLIKLVGKWLPVLIMLVNTEDDKEDPKSPVTEADFQDKAVDVVLKKVGIDLPTEHKSVTAEILKLGQGLWNK